MAENEVLQNLGFWMARKKHHKMDWVEFQKCSLKNGFKVIKVDLDKSLETQGPFKIFLHKLTDVITSADQGDPKSQNILECIEKYIETYPEMMVLDPIPRVRILLDRSKSYNLITNSILPEFGITTPNFVEIRSEDDLRKLQIGYPFICKSIIAHGESAHNMVIIFNENSIIDCLKPPCVAQKFIPHNAVLYKIFVLGDRFQIVQRPSLKNFTASTTKSSIAFDSHDISKNKSDSELTRLDNKIDNSMIPKLGIFKTIVKVLRAELEMTLFGVDVIIGNGGYYIIDVNAFPGYDGYPDFFPDLFYLINHNSDRDLCCTKQVLEKLIQDGNDDTELFTRKHSI